jgi:hypothetical protein
VVPISPRLLSTSATAPLPAVLGLPTDSLSLKWPS